MKFSSCLVRNPDGNVALVVTHELFSIRDKIFLHTKISTAKFFRDSVPLKSLADVFSELKQENLSLTGLTLDHQTIRQTAKRVAHEASYLVDSRMPNTLASFNLISILDKKINERYLHFVRPPINKSVQ